MKYGIRNLKAAQAMRQLPAQYKLSSARQSGLCPVHKHSMSHDVPVKIHMNILHNGKNGGGDLCEMCFADIFGLWLDDSMDEYGTPSRTPQIPLLPTDFSLALIIEPVVSHPRSSKQPVSYSKCSLKQNFPFLQSIQNFYLLDILLGL